MLSVIDSTLYLIICFIYIYLWDTSLKHVLNWICLKGAVCLCMQICEQNAQGMHIQSPTNSTAITRHFWGTKFLGRAGADLITAEEVWLPTEAACSCRSI